MTSHDTDIVSSLRLEIAQRMTQDRFDLWFAETEITVDWDARVVKVLADSPFTLDWLRSNVRQDVQLACDTVLGADFAVHYQSVPSAPRVDRRHDGRRRATLRTVTADQEDGAVAVSKPRRRYASFDQFVVGASNQVACLSAQLVANRLGETSPFFVYGPTGSGKSHLLESVVAEVRRTPGHRRCVHLFGRAIHSWIR